MFALGIALSVLIGVSLGLLGGGGSILTVPLLVYVFGLAPKQAIASSLLIVGVASLSGALQHGRAGNVRPREGLLFGLAGMLGAYAGGRASQLLDGGILLLLFAAMMLLTAAAMWRGRSARRSENAAGESRAPVKLALQGLAVGGFTGLVGAGGGFLIVPALALWAGLPMSAAVGTSLLVIALKSATGFAGYLSHVQVDYFLIGVVAASAVLGSFAGSRLATRVEPTALRRGFAVFVTLMACLILVREGALVAQTLAPALATSWPQALFALAVGVLAGRSSKRAEARRLELAFSDGAGI